jgi:hypothetical protein
VRPHHQRGRVEQETHQRPRQDRKGEEGGDRRRDHPQRDPREAANVIDPAAQRALLRTTRRALQMVLRLLAYNGEHWLANHLNTYLRDNDEYRAITRQTILRAIAGTITYTPEAITVQLQPPDSPRIARALALLLEEINNTPPHLPGDPRPISYSLNKP